MMKSLKGRIVGYVRSVRVQGYGLASLPVYQSVYVDSAEKTAGNYFFKIGLIALATIAIHFFLVSTIFAKYAKIKALGKIFLHEIMKRNVLNVGPRSTAMAVQLLCLKNKIRHVPVVDEDRKLVGVVTQRDIFRALTKKEERDEISLYDKSVLDSFIVSNLMTKDVVSLYSHDTLVKAIDIFLEKGYGCIPILDEDRHLIGIVTRTDIVQAIKLHLK